MEMLKDKLEKNLFFIFVLFSSLFFIPAVTQAYAESSSYNEQNDEAVIAVATDCYKQFEPNLSLSVGRIIPIISDNSDNILYEASYFCNNIPYGYSIISFTDNSYTPEYVSISENKKDLYEEISCDLIDSNLPYSVISTSTPILYKVSGLQYAIEIVDSNNNSMFYDNYGKIIESLDFDCKQAYNYASSWIIFISPNNWTKDKYKVDESSKIKLKKYTNRIRLLTESYVEKITRRYCCGIQALLQIAYMENLTSYSNLDIILTYNYLWNHAKVKTAFTENEIDYGECNIQSLNNAFVDFAKSKGYSHTTKNSIKSKPSVAWIKEKLANNNPILMGYQIKVDGKVEGHAISVIGYVRATKVSSGNTWNYLIVYNSWDNTLSYLNYSTVDFINCNAAYFSVKK
ncbi:MAG: hypothetical protein IJ746_03175 [Ruminococcus sp.]|nr:hypothetical protein [Ruminococcus sp.]